MGKLVRDKIPEIIKADGKEPIIRVLSEQEFLNELDKKLYEEVEEYQADKSLEELADVLEIVYTICESRGYAIEDLMEIKAQKKDKRGGFKDRIYWEGNK